MGHIYTLSDPRDNTVRYVGMSKNAYKRYGSHLTMQQGQTAKNAWIQELLNLHILPQLAVVETVTDEAAMRNREEYWIHKYLSEGAKLTNTQIPYDHTYAITSQITASDTVAPHQLVSLDGTPRVFKDRKYPSQITKDATLPLNVEGDYLAGQRAKEIALSMGCHLAIKMRPPATPPSIVGGVYCLRRHRQRQHFLYLAMPDEINAFSEQELRERIDALYKDEDGMQS